MPTERVSTVLRQPRVSASVRTWPWPRRRLQLFVHAEPGFEPERAGHRRHSSGHSHHPIGGGRSVRLVDAAGGHHL
jgi:hypothetical protein